jgi:FtsH-binding integral membrane protein
LIIGGEHKAHKFTVDDYVFAALTLYLDIIQLFMRLLRLLGKKK